MSHVPSLRARRVTSEATSTHLRRDDPTARTVAQAIWSQGIHPWFFCTVCTLKHKFSGLLAGAYLKPLWSHDYVTSTGINISMYLNHLSCGTCFTGRRGIFTNNPFRATITLPAQDFGHRKQLAPHLRPDDQTARTRAPPLPHTTIANLQEEVLPREAPKHDGFCFFVNLCISQMPGNKSVHAFSMFSMVGACVFGCQN